MTQSLSAAEFEVIVVNDSGDELLLPAWDHAANLQIINTQKRERSVARNIGAAIARGRFIHFLDDDDWLDPGFLEKMQHFARGQEAAWLYGISQLVDRNSQPLLQLHHQLQGNCFLQTMAGEWIPLQASLIKAAVFHEAGGFNPLLAGPEDIDLLRRISLRHDIAELPRTVAYIRRGEEGSTTNYKLHQAASRQAREYILKQTDVRNRLLDSVRNGQEFGRLLRIYLTSCVWNLQRGRFFTAVGRLWTGFQLFYLARFNLFRLEFWQAIVTVYKSPTFAQGWLNARKNDHKTSSLVQE